jgi:transcriptional regulator with XRE-family HTH domain
MSSIGERLKEAREAMGWTQARAGEMAGLDLRTIQRWEFGNRIPDRHRVMGLAYLYGRSLCWLYDDDSEYHPPLFREPLSDRISLLVRVLRSATASTGYSLGELFGLEGLSCHDFDGDSMPVPGDDFDPVSFPDSFPDSFPVRAAAGAGSEVLDESRASHLLMDPRWLRSHALNPDFCDVISVSGDSMEPTLPDGCSILVDRASTELTEGGMFVVRTAGGLVVKRAVLGGDGRWFLQSDNRFWETVPVGEDDLVVGKVRWFGRFF